MNEVLDERYTLPNARPPAPTTRIALALHLRPFSSSLQIFLAICVDNLARRKSSNHYARALFVEVIFSQKKKKKKTSFCCFFFFFFWFWFFFLLLLDTYIIVAILSVLLLVLHVRGREGCGLRNLQGRISAKQIYLLIGSTFE